MNRRPALAVASLIAAVALAGCSGGVSTSGTGPVASGSAGATGTSCDLSGCTVVLARGVDAKASVLGLDIRLVGVTGNQLTLDVAGQRTTLPLDANASTSVAGLQVTVQSADSERITLHVTKA